MPISVGSDIEVITIEQKDGTKMELRGDEARSWFAFAATAWKSAKVFNVPPPKFLWRKPEEMGDKPDEV